MSRDPYKIPHEVRLFDEAGKEVSRFTFPATDPRFVKADNIGPMAAGIADERVGATKWKTLRVTFYGAIYHADHLGRMLVM